MAVVFLLGPGMWEGGKRPAADPAPLSVRRCDRREFLRNENIGLWALHHSSVATIAKDEFKVLETGSRSRYLTAVARLGLRPLEWTSEPEMKEQARLLSAQL